MGSVTSSKFLHDWKAVVGTELTFLPTTSFFKAVEFWHKFAPSAVFTLSGIESSSNWVQPENAVSPIETNPSGIIALVSEVHPLNALFPMVLLAAPARVATGN